MTADSKTPITKPTHPAQGMLGLQPMIGPQMEQFWKAQDGVLEEAEAYSNAWFEHRHQAARSALGAIRKVNGNAADPSAAMQAIVEWQRHSFERLVEDARQWVNFCSNCTARMTNAEIKANKGSLKKIQNAPGSSDGAKGQSAA